MDYFAKAFYTLSMTSFKKKSGFTGEEAIVLPAKVIQQCLSTPLVSSLFITDIGYYPKAEYHYRERKNGINQHILIYCIDGKGESVIDGKKFIIKATNFLIIPSEKRHVYFSDKENPWSIFWMHFRGENADVIADLLYKKMLDENNVLIQNDQLIGLFRNIYKSLQLGYSLDNMLFSSITLYQFLSEFIYGDNKNKINQDLNDKSFNGVIQFLKSNIHRSLTLNEIASVYNLSPSYFSNKFKETTGYSPIEYFNHLKLQKACHLLRFTNLRISEIANEIGIVDPYYFSRLFSTHMGVSPKQFRVKKNMNNDSELDS